MLVTLWYLEAYEEVNGCVGVDAATKVCRRYRMANRYLLSPLLRSYGVPLSIVSITSKLRCARR